MRAGRSTEHNALGGARAIGRFAPAGCVAARSGRTCRAPPRCLNLNDNGEPKAQAGHTLRPGSSGTSTLFTGLCLPQAHNKFQPVPELDSAGIAWVTFLRVEGVIRVSDDPPRGEAGMGAHEELAARIPSPVGQAPPGGEIEVGPPMRFDPGLAEEMADRLIEKREKLQYFLVTAATAVIVFTFNDFNDPQGILQEGSVRLTLAGWLVLLLSSALALYGLRARHWVYSRAIADMRSEDPLPLEQKRAGVQTRIIWASHLMWAFFIIGTGLMAFSYSLALL